MYPLSRKMLHASVPLREHFSSHKGIPRSEKWLSLLYESRERLYKISPPPPLLILGGGTEVFWGFFEDSHEEEISFTPPI